VTRWLPLSGACAIISNYQAMVIVGHDAPAIVRAAVRRENVRKLGLRGSDFSRTPIEHIPPHARIDIDSCRVSVAGTFTPGTFNPGNAGYSWNEVVLSEDDYRNFSQTVTVSCLRNRSPSHCRNLPKLNPRQREGRAASTIELMTNRLLPMPSLACDPVNTEPPPMPLGHSQRRLQAPEKRKAACTDS
jgi:hypothetical protein